jgi:hypothetical protein
MVALRLASFRLTFCIASATVAGADVTAQEREYTPAPGYCQCLPRRGCPLHPPRGQRGNEPGRELSRNRRSATRFPGHPAVESDHCHSRAQQHRGWPLYPPQERGDGIRGQAQSRRHGQSQLTTLANSGYSHSCGEGSSANWMASSSDIARPSAHTAAYLFSPRAIRVSSTSRS